MFLLAGCLRLAGFFDWAAETTLRHVRTPTTLLGALVLVSGVLSALLVNDTVCVMLAPLVIALIERSALPIRPYLFALAAGTNIGGVMPIVGGLQAAHILAQAGALIQPLIGAPGALGAFHLSWISTVASNVVSNVPWVLVAIRWIGLDGAGQRPWLLLALTSTFAGNLTLFGSVANVIVFETAHERI